ncbi:MAG TPA: response regulator transcription factor [Vicinamibacterales bacterium]|jgi:DNA-binding NarL/FixJ family response regulator
MTMPSDKETGRSQRRDVQGVRILIADDHELVRQGMRTILQGEPGWTVCGEATNGRQAVTMALELRPDLVVLDIAMPELNGVEVIHQIRRALTVPILIVTMYDADDVLREATEAGADGYVLKAEAGRTLVNAARTLLHRGDAADRPRPGGSEAAAGDGAAEVLRRPRGRELTSREREVLQLLVEGRGNKEIAAALGITTKTAETHRARIMSKLDMHSMSELVRYAIRNRIIEP